MVFFTFFISIPGAVMSKSRVFLRVTSWLIIACALFSLALGLDIWFSTLSTKTNFGALWAQQTAAEQSLLQQQVNWIGTPLVRDGSNNSSNIYAVQLLWMDEQYKPAFCDRQRLPNGCRCSPASWMRGAVLVFRQ